MNDDFVTGEFPLRLCVKCFAPYRALFCMNCLESNEYAQGQLNGWNAAQQEIKKKDDEIAVLKEMLAVYKDLSHRHMEFAASICGVRR